MAIVRMLPRGTSYYSESTRYYLEEYVRGGGGSAPGALPSKSCREDGPYMRNELRLH